VQPEEACCCPEETSHQEANWRKSNTAVIFTGPPPNATEAERDQWLALWYRRHSTKMTQEGIVQCLTPHRTTPQWVQTWADNAHAHFARLASANASSNNPGTNTLEENQLVPPDAAAAHAAPPPNATEAEITEAASAWISSHRVNVTDGVSGPGPKCPPVRTRPDGPQSSTNQELETGGLPQRKENPSTGTREKKIAHSRHIRKNQPPLWPNRECPDKRPTGSGRHGRQHIQHCGECHN